MKLDAFGVKCQSNTTTDNLVGVLLVPYFRQVCHYAYSAFVLFDFSVFLQLNTNPKKKILVPIMLAHSEGAPPHVRIGTLIL